MQQDWVTEAALSRRLHSRQFRASCGVGGREKKNLQHDLVQLHMECWTQLDHVSCNLHSAVLEGRARIKDSSHTRLHLKVTSARKLQAGKTGSQHFSF